MNKIFNTYKKLRKGEHVELLKIMLVIPIETFVLLFPLNFGQLLNNNIYYLQQIKTIEVLHLNKPKWLETFQICPCNSFLPFHPTKHLV